MWTLPSASTLDTRKTLPDSDLRNSSLSLAGGLEHTHVYATSHSYPAVCKAKCSADRSPFNEGKCGGSSNSDYRCLETEHGLARYHLGRLC